MFEGIKRFFIGAPKPPMVLPIVEIDGLKIMTPEEIAKDNIAFLDPWLVVRYLYTKDKARDNVNPVGFIGRQE